MRYMVPLNGWAAVMVVTFGCAELGDTPDAIGGMDQGGASQSYNIPGREVRPTSMAGGAKIDDLGHLAGHPNESDAAGISALGGLMGGNPEQGMGMTAGRSTGEGGGAASSGGAVAMGGEGAMPMGGSPTPTGGQPAMGGVPVGDECDLADL